MPASPRLRRFGDQAVGQASQALAALALIGLLLAVMWGLEILDYAMDGRLDQYGLEARNVDDLPDLFTSPFLHFGFDHLIGNTVPFAVLGFIAAVRGVGKFVAMNLLVIILGGLGEWLISPPNTLTLGASGLVFGYFGYLVGRGIFERHLVDALLAVAVGVLYGGILYGVLPTDLPISWQGHLCGLIAGFLSAYVLRRRKRNLPAAPSVPGLPG
ncbi:rhomboid family intramembrane serine protease [Actinocorallia longicatena]|uniref:Rhomboid family intramembrane serine protease n=1 Tax=Actinocorallia longicatena TaxID=111803 RepID=A0ABP6QF11_9ACTN